MKKIYENDNDCCWYRYIILIKRILGIKWILKKKKKEIFLRNLTEFFLFIWINAIYIHLAMPISMICAIYILRD